MAEGRVVVEDLEREITCAICHDLYTEPKVLPCCHYYCKQCLHRLALRTGLDRPFSCPECRKDATLPQASADNLPTAFFVNRIKEMHSRLERVLCIVETKCEICCEAIAEAFCRECACVICAECVLQHQRMKKVFFGHQIVSLKELREEEAKEIVKQVPTLQTCAVHEQPMNIFCFDCNTLICRDCTIKPHNNHNYEFIKVAAPEMKKKLIQQLEPLKEANETLLHAVKAVQTTKSEVEAQGKSVEQNIESSINEFIQIIQHRKQELVTEAREKVTRKLDCLSGQEERLSTACATVQSVIEYTERCVEHSADDEVMCMHTELQSRIDSEIEQSKKEKNLEPVEEIDMRLEVSCVQDLKQLCQNKVKLTQFFIQATLTGEGMKAAEVNQPSKVQLVTKLSNGTPTKQSCIVECSLKSLVNGSTIKCCVSRFQANTYNICYTPIIRGRHELTVTVNGREVAGSPFHLHVSIHPTQLGKPVQVITEESIPLFQDVAVNSAGEVVVVTQCGNIMVYNKSGKRLRSSKASNYNTMALHGVTIDSSNDHIFISGEMKGIFGHSHKIICLSPDLKLANEVSIDGELSGMMGLTIVGKEVMVRDSKCSSIMVYTTELKYVRRIGFPGSGPGQFSYIRDVSSDEHGNLYISDRGKVCIHVFSKGGEFIRSISCKATGGKWPSGVYVSGRHVFVADYTTHSISIFTTEGEYVTSFGQYGKKEGDLIRPCGICVDKDGFVYVCEFNNHRLQVF